MDDQRDAGEEEDGQRERAGQAMRRLGHPPRRDHRLGRTTITCGGGGA